MRKNPFCRKGFPIKLFAANHKLLSATGTSHSAKALPRARQTLSAGWDSFSSSASLPMVRHLKAIVPYGNLTIVRVAGGPQSLVFDPLHEKI